MFCYSLSNHNRYLTAILQRIHQSVIVIYGYAVDHSVPQLFIKLDGRSFKLGEFKELTRETFGTKHSRALKATRDMSVNR
jgi:hypothetical protein